MKFDSNEAFVSRSCLSVIGSLVSCPYTVLSIVFCNIFLRPETTSEWIFNCFSLCIFDRVSLSLQEILGSNGTPKYSPIRTSTCFLTNGTNSTDVAVPIP